MMTINVIDCVTWLVCNLQSRDIFLNLSSKIEIWRHQSTSFVKETYFQTLQGFIVSLTWETEKLIKMSKKLACKIWSQFKMSYFSMGKSYRGVWFWLENVLDETLSTGPLPKLQKNFVHGQDIQPPPCMSKRLNVSSYIWGKQCKCLFTC